MDDNIIYAVPLYETTSKEKAKEIFSTLKNEKPYKH